MPSFTLRKEERLKSRKLIGQLFREGNSFVAYPIRLIWKPLDSVNNDSPVLFALSVPKRSFPKAVQRNPLRRRIREAYRLNKHILYEQLSDDKQQYAFMLLYTAKVPLPFSAIDKAIKKIIRRFLKEIDTAPVS